PLHAQHRRRHHARGVSDRIRRDRYQPRRCHRFCRIHGVVDGANMSAVRRKAKAKSTRKAKVKSTRKWSAGVMQRSDALDLESGVSKNGSPGRVALSLRGAGGASHRRKSSPFRSAMSMLNFEINRAGRNLSPERRKVLSEAKAELRKVF